MRKTLIDLTKDTLTYGFASVLGQVIGFLLLPVYTTYLTTVDYGIMAMIAFIGIFFTPLANMGVTNAIFRRFNMHKEVDLQITSLSVGSIFVVFTSLIWLGIGLLFSEQLTYLLVDDLIYLSLVRISLVSGFFISISQVFTVVLRAERRVRQLSIVKIAELLITVGFSIFFVVVQKMGVKGVILGALIGAVFSCCAQFILCKTYLKLRFVLGELRELLKYGIPFLPHRLIGHGSNFLGQYFIKEFIGMSETGLYNIALRLALPLSFMITSIQSAWVPIKYQTHREEGEKSAVIFRQLISFYFIVITFLFAGSVIVGPELLRLMTAAEYHSAVYLLPFVLIMVYSRGVYYMMSTGFEFTDNTRPMPLVSGSGFIVLFAVGYFSFERMGIYGVIAGLSASWLIMAIVIRYFARQRFYVPINFGLLFKLFFMVILLSTVVFLLQDFGLTSRLSIEVVLGLVSLGIIILFIGFNKDLKSLDLNKYPMFSKLNKFVLPIVNAIRK